MKTEKRELFKRLLSIRNVVPLLIIVIAFITTFLKAPFGLQQDEVILTLLAFLAIDSLIERLETLHNIEKDIKRVKDLAESQTSGNGLLRHREDFPRLEQIIGEAKQEIWISGITLDIMATLSGLFQQKAREGVRVKLLGVIPNDNLGEEIASYFGFEKAEISIRITSNLNALYNRVVRNFPQSASLRTTPYRLASGYFIIDPDSDQGHMTITEYFYQTPDSHWSPVLFLSKRTDSHWFTLYLNNFNRLWDSATDWKSS